MKKSLQMRSQHKLAQQESMNPLLGGLIGASIGAVVGTVMTIALRNDEVRKKAEKFVDKTLDVLKEINERPEGVQTVVEEAVDTTVDAAKKKLLKTKSG